ncbi:MAG: menaquinone biosynthesis protein [Planctomycetes bacterium]|nr:menaquinone biosynthesis protein [Planctomycetota bacterium]
MPDSQPTARAALRVGSVPYLVGRPLDFELEREPGLAYQRAVPSRLVEQLRAGELDVALVSSIELFRRPGYAYIDGLAVAGRGAVHSVQLFLRTPLERVRTIALDPASRTSAVLVEIELAARFGRRPELIELAAGADPRAASADAWLQIGDAALRAALAPGAPPTFNPSQAWTERTGLPFVFACWVVGPAAVASVAPALFQTARDRARGGTSELARQAAHEWHLPEHDCRDYLERECVYELEPAAMRAALFAFRDAAAVLGRCEAGLEPRALSPAGVRR